MKTSVQILSKEKKCGVKWHESVIPVLVGRSRGRSGGKEMAQISKAHEPVSLAELVSLSQKLKMESEKEIPGIDPNLHMCGLRPLPTSTHTHIQHSSWHDPQSPHAWVQTSTNKHTHTHMQHSSHMHTQLHFSCCGKYLLRYLAGYNSHFWRESFPHISCLLHNSW